MQSLFSICTFVYFCIIWAPLYTFVYTNVHSLCRSLYTSLCILLPFCILCTTPWRKITSDHFMKTCHNFFPPRINHKRESPTDIVRLKHFPAVTITLCYTETCIINMLLLLTVSSFVPCWGWRASSRLTHRGGRVASYVQWPHGLANIVIRHWIESKRVWRGKAFPGKKGWAMVMSDGSDPDEHSDLILQGGLIFAVSSSYPVRENGNWAKVKSSSNMRMCGCE